MYSVDRAAVGQIGPEEARRQIETICASQAFRNRDSFRRLLTYLADRTLDGSADTLKEYTLGLELFGKPETYDPREDATVRVQISKLRQKLEEYYLSEGKDDPVLVELPRRHLALTFQTRAVPAVAVPSPPPPVRSRLRGWQVAIGAILLGLIGFELGRHFGSNPMPAAASTTPLAPELETFWGPMLSNGRPVVVSLGTPMFIRFRGGRIRTSGIDDPEKAKTDPRIRRILGMFNTEDPQPSYIYTGVGEAEGAFQLAKLFTRFNRELQLRRNSSMTWEEISANNLIILGSAKYNPQIRDLPLQQTFIVEQNGVANLHPRPGEPAKFLRRYTEDADRNIVEEYAVISRLPGVNGRGSIVVLGASATEGTAAAVQYATDSVHLRNLFGRIAGNSGKVPKYFEVVVRVQFRSMVPVATEYQTHREVTAPQAY
jgi:hypothetical protein